MAARGGSWVARHPWWAALLGALGLGAGVAVVGFASGALKAPALGIGGKAITLAPGSMSVALTTGQVLEVNLPSGATWALPGLVVGANGSAATQPTSGTTQGRFTYGGGGNLSNATWTDSSGKLQDTIITVTG